jgi:copper chaperone CopZ
MDHLCLRYVGMKQPTPQPHNYATVQITTLDITGMSCDACARHVASSLGALKGVVHALVDLQRSEAVVEHLPAYSAAAVLVAAVQDAGYTAQVGHTIDDSEISAPVSETSGRCGCCCGTRPNAAEWSNLGTSTIG